VSRRRALPWRAALTVALLAVVVGVPLALASELGKDSATSSGPVQSGAATPKPLLDRAAGAGRAVRAEEGSTRFAVDLSKPDVMHVHFGRAPRAGLLFDVRTGRVLWRLAPERRLPIASLTKMMTALLVSERTRAGDRARITREALNYTGSGMGVLRRGRRVPVQTLLHGLLLPSGNDAAIALALRVSGSQRAFVGRMNERAALMGLTCTRFASPSGIVDRGNHSCAADLAQLARAVLDDARLARIVRRRRAVLPFHTKGGHIFLYNNNPLVRLGYPGVLGVKTGYTRAAGRCLVAAARRGGRRLGVVLLRSPDPGRQARRLLDAGFRLRA